LDNFSSVKAKIVDFVWYTKRIFALKVFTPEISKVVKPGQFVMIRGENWNYHPILSRPMSIARTDLINQIIEIQILVTGEGTLELSKLKIDDHVNLVGPMGNSFYLPDKEEKIAFIGGGIGIAPLIFLDEVLSSRGQIGEIFYGAASVNELIARKHLPDRIKVSTDDGSSGFNGYVTEYFKKFTNINNVDRVYACGPTPMLIAVQKLLSDLKIPGQLSIETIMACGYGLCQGCAVKQKGDEQKYYLTCKDGPVFDSESISFE